jgi:hypothetical protein
MSPACRYFFSVARSLAVRPCTRPGISRNSPFNPTHSNASANPIEPMIAPAKAAYSMNPFMTASRIAGLISDSR